MAKFKATIGENTSIEIVQQGKGDSAWVTIHQGSKFVQIAAKHSHLQDVAYALDAYLNEAVKKRPVKR